MKKATIYFLAILAALSVQAQQNITTSAVTITANSNKSLQIFVDGRDYNLIGNAATGNKTTITINNLEMGQHTLLFARADQNTNRADRITTIFNLRYRFDMLIKLNGNGSLELIETKKTGMSDNQAPMSSTDFNNLLRQVRNQRSTNGRRTVIANVFNISNNYFTTYQVTQLLQLVNSENYRLELAKLSYRSVTDRSNFNQLYYLLNSQASRNELEDYVDNYLDDDDDQNVAMSDANFNNLYQSIQQQWPVSTQMNSLTNAFNATNNFFSAYQASRLIQLVTAENNRLQLAKLSYRSITDRNNFNQIYNLFNSQSSKNELAAYVNNYQDDGNQNVVMSDANFNNLYQSIQQQWPVSTQMNSLTNAFNATNNYFSTYQASRLIQLVTAENNRLQLAKLSYRSITDRNNFNQIYNLLSSQASKNELATYINNNYNTGSSPNVAMSDADFTVLFQTIERQYLPFEQMNSLTDVFNNTRYYFTTVQVKKLIPLVSLESNRLQLAKLSYRTIIDRNNFSQVYDLIESQAGRNELDAYVKAYQD